MKKLLLLLLLIPALIVVSCKKEKDADVPVDQQTPLVFNSLTATDTIIRVNSLTTITASATGDGLTYTWECEYGSVIGSGSQVQWTVCHADVFWISCTVTDKYNATSKKTINIHSNV